MSVQRSVSGKGPRQAGAGTKSPDFAGAGTKNHKGGHKELIHYLRNRLYFFLPSEGFKRQFYRIHLQLVDTFHEAVKLRKVGVLVVAGICYISSCFPQITQISAEWLRRKD